MADNEFVPISPARVYWREETPVAEAYADGYFSAGDGVAESDYVFLRQNGLQARFQTLPADGLFRIGETGFGTGLNFLLAARLFLHTAPDGATLHFLSAEKHPLYRADLERACRQHPVASELAAELLEQYPPATPGFHRMCLAGGRIRLTLLFGDATALLALAPAAIDAWFLDGFAPARNPELWQPALFRELARLSRPGASLATFTAAGFVRRGLAEAGFAMEKREGFGRKRHMLAGQFPGEWRPDRLDRRAVAIIGAGLAGCTLARVLAERGCRVTVFDGRGVAQQASGNLAGVVYTTPSAHPTPQNRFYQSSFLQALHWFRRLGFPRTPADGALDGVMQLPPHERGARKVRNALVSGHWPESVLQRAGGDDHWPRLYFPGGGYISPPGWCRHLLDHPGIRLCQEDVDGLAADTGGWQLRTATATALFPRVVLANAEGARRFQNLAALPLKSIRGQVSYCRATAASARWRQAWCHQGYLTPALEGLHCVGATFDLHGEDPAPAEADDRENLDTLRRNLPQHWQELGGELIEVAGRRVGFRCQSRDFLPLAGPVPGSAGLYLDIAHGSRGITGTPLCAELLASMLCGEPLPVDRRLLDALLPQRFSERSPEAENGD